MFFVFFGVRERTPIVKVFSIAQFCFASSRWIWNLFHTPDSTVCMPVGFWNTKSAIGKRLHNFSKNCTTVWIDSCFGESIKTKEISLQQILCARASVSYLVQVYTFADLKCCWQWILLLRHPYIFWMAWDWYYVQQSCHFHFAFVLFSFALSFFRTVLNFCIDSK